MSTPSWSTFTCPRSKGAAALEALRKTVRRDTPVAFYLYTADNAIALSYRALGFDGAFIEKGDTRRLAEQVEATNRILNLRHLPAPSSSTLMETPSPTPSQLNRSVALGCLPCCSRWLGNSLPSRPPVRTPCWH